MPSRRCSLPPSRAATRGHRQLCSLSAVPSALLRTVDELTAQPSQPQRLNVQKVTNDGVVHGFGVKALVTPTHARAHTRPLSSQPVLRL